MSNKKGKLPPNETANPKLMRDVLRGAGLTAVIASENPVERYDDERKMVVKEVLLMEGMELRGGRNQLPIVDSHNDRTVRNIFGSIRNIRVEGSQLVGETAFATDTESQTIEQRMQEGHITDFSISADILASEFINRGQSYTTTTGQYVEGPAVIVTHWMPYNASICATGADEQSTVRRSYTDLKRKVIRMDEALLSQLSAMGLPDGMTDPNQVLAWVVGKLSGGESEAPEGVEAMAEPVVEKMDEPMSEVVEKMDEPPMEEKPVVENSIATRQKAESQIKRALDQDQARRKEIRSACELAKLERSFADELCDGFVSVVDAQKRIMERMATQPSGQSVGADFRVTASSDDKFYNAVSAGLVQRAFKHGGFKNKPRVEADGSEDFANTSMKQIATMFVERMGVRNVHNIPAPDVARMAMGHRPTLQRYRVERSEIAYHSTGSFANLMLDAANKTLLAGYEEAPFTWNVWARQAQSVDDFKPINRIRLSEMADPEVVPEGTDYPETKMSDAKESYKVEKYGSIFSVTWETVVNDDLDALSRIPAAQGAACRRKQNKAVYNVLTANNNMADGFALFNSTAQFSSAGAATGHANLSGSGANPSVTTLNAAYLAMMTMKGLNPAVTLNIMPTYLIVPAALSATAMEVLGSLARPEVGGSAAGNSNTHNIYGPAGDRRLQLVVEPVLDANSTSAWYVAASNNQVDTVELAFLSGEESPVLESEWGFDNDVYKYKVRQTFGVAAIDYRGLYKYAAS